MSALLPVEKFLRTPMAVYSSDLAGNQLYDNIVAGVQVDVCNFFSVRAGVFASKSKKCDTTDLWCVWP